ncbi:MAG: ABC transporter ATP-binding protein [Deltaproteobacteria bacterium]|nr:ABC transporter ATP-binding protein [Deltaproteobacteria bacterium]
MQDTPSTGSVPAAEALDLTVRYAALRALDGVRCALRSGAVTGLLGPNGAGKSTLIKSFLGFLSPAAGRCRVLGADPRGDPLAVRRRLGYMPEHDAAFPGRTGLEAVVLAGRLAGMPREAAFSRAYEVLDYLGMDEVRHRPLAGYSVGQRQKVKLGQAVVHGPRLLFLDEPLSGLDPASRDEMLALLAGIAASGVAMVISSHVLRDLESLCGDVLVLDRGRVLYQGSMEGLRRRDEGRYRLRIKGDAAAFARALEALGGRAAAAPPFLDLHLAPPLDTAAIWSAARETGCQVRELRVATDSLEEAFLRLLGREG